MRRWDPVRGRPAAPPIEVGHRGASQCLAVAEWGGRPVVLTAGNDGYLSMWDAATGERLRHEVTGSFPARDLVVAPIQGRPVIVITRYINEPVRFLDLDTWDDADLQVEDWRWDQVWGVVSPSDGPTMVTTDGDHTLRLWNLDGRTWRPRDIDHPAPVMAVAVAATPRPLIAVAYGDCTVAFLDPATGGQITDPLQLPEPAAVLAFGPRGELAVCYGTDLAVFASQ